MAACICILRYMSVIDAFLQDMCIIFLLDSYYDTCNAFMQVLAKITIKKNLFNKVKSFSLCFTTKRDFDCEQVEQQTSQTKLKRV